MILTESVLNDIKDKLMSAKEVAIEAIKSTAKQLNMDLKFLLTWGASIGGLMGPLSDYINGNYPEIDEASVYSLIVGAVSIVFYNNEKQIRKVIEDIQEKGLSDVFKAKTLSNKNTENKYKLPDFIFKSNNVNNNFKNSLLNNDRNNNIENKTKPINYISRKSLIFSRNNSGYFSNLLG
jgi:hypothetical protein